jgi:hypothetical protein
LSGRLRRKLCKKWVRQIVSKMGSAGNLQVNFS